MIEQGLAALEAGDRDSAAAICRQVLDRRPTLARAHYLAGLIELDRGRRGAAEKAFARAVKINPKHSGAWAELARVLLTRGELATAEACLDSAIATERGSAKVEDVLGVAFRLAGNLHASLDCHLNAVRNAPGNPAYRLNLANARLAVGDRDSASAALDACLAMDPTDARAHWLRSQALTATSDEHLRSMQDLLAKEAGKKARVYLLYAIGSEYEDLGAWEEAFDAYSSAAALRRAAIEYDEDAEQALFDTLESLFTEAWMQSQAGECYSGCPIFIVGQPRCGGELLERMLAAHPVVTSAGELRHFGIAVRQAATGERHEPFSAALIEAAAHADVTRIGETYVASTARLRGGAAHMIDRLPRNFYFLPLILAALPNARVLHVEREPMDSCFAAFRQLFPGGYPYSYEQRETARHHVRYRRFMDTMRERFGGRFHDVRYEDLVSDTENALRGVLEYVGLSWNEACLGNVVHDGGATVGRWRHFEAQLAPMREVLDEAGLV